MKIAILYGTKYGATEKVAKLISKSLENYSKDNQDSNETIDLKLINLKQTNNVSLDEDVLIIGGSVYMGRIRKEVRKFVKKNKNTLIEKDLALFICGCSEDEGIKQIDSNFPSEIVSHAMATAFILGEFDLDKMGFFDRKIAQSIIKGTKKEFETDTSAIDEFAEKIMKK